MKCCTVRCFLFGSLVSIFLKFSIFQAIALPGTLTLAWDPSSDPSVVGYRLYDGIASLDYTNVLDIGNNLTMTIDGLVPGLTYFFAVTAYDSTGLESAFSGEIAYNVPPIIPLPPTPQLFLSVDGSNFPVLSGSGPAGYVYDVCASMDLTDWPVIGTVIIDLFGGFQFTDGSGLSMPWRFYRLKQILP